MKIIDISQEIFSAPVYPGDPIPQKSSVLNMRQGDPCNLSAIQMGSHSGTHLDAPNHFYKEGKTIEQLSLEKCMGFCKVISLEGIVLKTHIEKALLDQTERLLIKGNIELTLDAAKELVKHEILLLGVEGQTVGTEETQIPIHLTLLKKEIIILEGLILSEVEDGNYFLAAQPLKMEGLDGSPVRAVLLEELTFTERK